MCTVALLLACLVCVGHARRAKIGSEQTLFRHPGPDEQVGQHSPLTSLASLLLTFQNPAAGWLIGAQSRGSSVSRPVIAPLHRTCMPVSISSPSGWPCSRSTQLHIRRRDVSMQLNESFDAVTTDSITESSEKLNFLQKIRQQWARSCKDFKVRPFSYITIPIVAACVGYVTNWVGVKMLFYPVRWTGIPLLRYPEEPFGWLGWQGIVPAKRYRMAQKMVDVTITKLLDVGEIFKRLNPKALARLLEPDVRSRVLGGFSLPVINRHFLGGSCKAVINRAPDVVNIRSLVVSGLTKDATTLSNFFQSVGRKELTFLINSGFGVGFVLGIAQMLVWMIYPAGWTLPVVGSLVGYITNWVALKWIFEPLNPTRIGPFVLQGMFLTRQKEVAEEFSEYIARAILCSKRVWADVLDGPTTGLFTNICGSRLPLPIGQVKNIVSHLKTTIGSGVDHPLHSYVDKTLRLRQTLETKMKAMSTQQFEQVLHPIFQEDELTLILAGAVLGAAAGALQWWQNDKIDNWINMLQAKFDTWRNNKFGKSSSKNDEEVQAK